MNTEILSIGESIVRLRNSRGISQERLAIEAGVDRRYLSDLENNKRNPSLEIISRLAHYFGLSLAQFFMLAESRLTLQELKDALCDAGCEDAIVFENPDYAKALVGHTHDYRAVYSYTSMIACLMEEGMSYEDAAEFIDYNTIRAIPYMGPTAPVILFDL